tara:strand:+ start:1369 stop:2247 length:879 start_codon:yes stop_codon:yes gene_type:complete
MKHAELVSTSIHPRHWADAWRIEVETYDKIGNSAKMARFFAKQNIEIIATESITNSSGVKHTMSFIVCCYNYKNVLDKDNKFRRKNKESKLDALKGDLLLEFIDQLTLNERGQPKLKIRRMSSLYAMSVDRQQETDWSLRETIIGPSGSGVVDLDDEYFNYLLETFGPNLSYMHSADTKNRILRTLVFRHNEVGFRTIRVLIEASNSKKIEKMFEILARRGANIVRHNLYSTIGAHGQHVIFGKTPNLEAEITFEWTGDAARRRPDDRLNTLVSTLRRDPVLTSDGFVVEVA